MASEFREGHRGEHNRTATKEDIQYVLDTLRSIRYDIFTWLNVLNQNQGTTIRLEREMNATTQALVDEVAATRTVEAAGQAAILGALQQVQDAINSGVDPVVVNDMIESLKAGAADLAAAIPQNTTGNTVPVDTGDAEVPPPSSVPDSNA